MSQNPIFTGAGVAIVTPMDEYGNCSLKAYTGSSFIYS